MKEHYRILRWAILIGGILYIVAPPCMGVFCFVLALVGHMGDPEECFPYREYITWSPDSHRLAVGGDRGLYLFNDQLELIAHADIIKYIYGLSYTPTGHYMLVATGQNGYRPLDGEKLTDATVVLPSGILAPYWSPDGTWLAGYIQDGVYNYSLHIWPVQGDDVLIARDQIIQENLNAFGALAWSPDGRMLAGATLNRTLRVWDIQSRQTLFTFAETGNTPWRVWPVWGPKSQSVAMVVSGPYGDPDLIRLWNVSTGQLEWTYTSQTHWQHISANPDSTHWAVVEYAGVLQIWDVENRRVSHTLDSANNYITAAVWSPDGSKIAATGWISDKNGVRIYDAATGAILATTLYEGDLSCD